MTPGAPLSAPLPRDGFLPDGPALRARAAGENFPVALRGLPRILRRDLLGLYDVARLIDEVGDAAPGDRQALLDALETDLRAAFEGRARHPVLRALTPIVRARHLPLAPFLRLVEANRRDQRHPVTPTWEALRDYCALSANPVGELVLHLFDQAEPAALARADDVCTALQILEHCQDVAEDFAAGRVYLPATELARFGCAPEELGRTPASPALRRVIGHQVAWSRALLVSGDRLVRGLRGWARPVVAAYVAGGWATCRALARAGFDPNTAPVRPRRRDFLRAWLALLLRARLA